MWAIFLVFGQVWATATAHVTPSADCMLVIRKMWCGLGTALSQRKSVQPSTKIVRHFSSSATGPSAGVLPLEVIPQKKSIFSDSFSRRSSLTLASVPAASSALRISIFRLPRRPPAALISSAASSWPLYMGSPSTAAGPVKNVMWPILYGVSGILPLGFSCAWATPTDGMTDPADAVSAAPTLTPSVLKKSRRFTSPAMLFPPLGSLPSDGRLPCPRGLRSSNIRSDQCQDARRICPRYNQRSGRFVPGNHVLRRVGGAGVMAWRGIRAAVRARPGAFFTIAGAGLALDLTLPAPVLAGARTPWTYFTFNPWLKKLPQDVISGETLEKKLDFLSRVALFWFTADGPYGVPEWGFAVDTMDVLRFVVMALLVGVYGALWLHARQQGRVSGWRASASRSGAVGRAFSSVLGLSTGPCSVVGCGAPVLPVVGLVFTGLSSGTLAVLSVSSRIAAAGVLVLLSAAVAYLGWQVATTSTSGGATPLPPTFIKTC